MLIPWARSRRRILKIAGSAGPVDGTASAWCSPAEAGNAPAVADVVGRCPLAEASDAPAAADVTVWCPLAEASYAPAARDAAAAFCAALCEGFGT